MTTNSLPTDYQSFIHLSRYSRWVDLLKRRETWGETVSRYIENVIKPVLKGDPVVGEIEQAVLGLEVMPSMRGLMTAGKALDRDNTCLFNCSYLTVDHVRSFDEAMFILLCGTGVGFSVERQYVSKLPDVPEEFQDTDSVIDVKDSKEGWASALRELIGLLYSGVVPKWDVSKVRPAGARLKTFGGRASGPAPLVELFNFAIATFKKAAGRKLSSIECHDLMCKIGEVVVVGGVRRSAMISLSNLSDDRMRHAKSGNWWETNPQRALANNSVSYTEKPDMETFLREWTALVESKSGERGIFNRVASKKQALKNGRREVDLWEYGTNPCLHPDSLVETVEGRVKIKDITQPTKVYTMMEDGSLGIKKCSASWVSKKNAKTIIVTVGSGKSVTCTPDHKIYVADKGWVEAGNLKIGDKLIHLCRARRGVAYSGVKLSCEDNRAYQMEHRLIAKSMYGDFGDDYDVHHIDGDTYNNAYENLEVLPHSEHSSYTAKYDNPQNHQEYGYHGKGLTGWGYLATGKKGKTIIPMPDELKSNMKNQNSANVVSITEGPVTDVYDLTVEDTHNFIADFIVVHNCSEIILRPQQFCNLSEPVIRATDTFETIKRKIRLATIIGTVQSTYTKFPYLRKIWEKNTNEERLLGVSLTGIMDNPNLLSMDLNELKQVAIDANKEYADKLGIPVSAAITCVKPSGTVSQLVDSASGIHARHSPFYIRTVRGDNKDPLTQFMIDSGIPSEPCVMKPETTTVFSFPQRSPDGAVTRNDMTAIEQLEVWLKLQRDWCEHKPSITVSVRDHEWMEVGAFVYKYFDEMSGVSFLPHSDHTYQQAPYQDCAEEEYNEMLAKMPSSIDWRKLGEYEFDDNTSGSQTLSCTAGACEIVDI